MKKLYLIGGPMGIGKTTACRIMKEQTDRCVFLDGDWCWDMHPFAVTDETKAMVMDNITHLLRNILSCTAYDTVIFCWVMHEQAILNTLLSRLDTRRCEVHAVSLVCNTESLGCRLQKDVDAGLRTADVIPHSLAYLPLYDRLNTEKVDVSNLTPQQAADRILAL